MKIKIDEFGSLWIKRGNMMKSTSCPHSAATVSCGDWCPLFGEPDKIHIDDDVWRCSLGTCDKTLFPEEIIDERR
jgi:hypothetical protein